SATRDTATMVRAVDRTRSWVQTHSPASSCGRRSTSRGAMTAEDAFTVANTVWAKRAATAYTATFAGGAAMPITRRSIRSFSAAATITARKAKEAWIQTRGV